MKRPGLSVWPCIGYKYVCLVVFAMLKNTLFAQIDAYGLLFRIASGNKKQLGRETRVTRSRLLSSAYADEAVAFLKKAAASNVATNSYRRVLRFLSGKRSEIHSRWLEDIMQRSLFWFCALLSFLHAGLIKKSKWLPTPRRSMNIHFNVVPSIQVN